MNWDVLINELQSTCNFIAHPPADPIEISKIENSMGIKLPQDYKELLIVSGALEWQGGNELFGVSPDEDLSTISNTEYFQNLEPPTDFHPFPERGNVIMSYGGGGFYFLFSKDSKRSGQVGLFLDETFWKEDQTWHGFVDFMRDTISYLAPNWARKLDDLT